MEFRIDMCSIFSKRLFKVNACRYNINALAVATHGRISSTKYRFVMRFIENHRVGFSDETITMIAF